MTSGADDDPPRKTNGSGTKGNGHDPSHVISFPDKKERDRLRKEREEIERSKQANEDVWRKAYGEQNKPEKVSFFTERAKNIPPFTLTIIVTFILIHLGTLLLSPEQYEWLLMNFSLIPARYTGDLPWSMTALLAPVTSLLMHYDFTHLAMNTVMMLVIGVFLEPAFGVRRTLIFFLICGLSGNLLFFLFNWGLLKPVLGASGAIQGFFAVFLIINWSRLPTPPNIRKHKYTTIMLFWVGLTVLLGFVIPGTAWEAHLGGLLAGWGIFELWKRGKIKV